MKPNQKIESDAPFWYHQAGLAVQSIILLLFVVTAIGIHRYNGTQFPFWPAVIGCVLHFLMIALHVFGLIIGVLQANERDRRSPGSLSIISNSACVVCDRSLTGEYGVVSYTKLDVGCICCECRVKYVSYLGWARYVAPDPYTGQPMYAYYCPDCLPQPDAMKTDVDIGTECMRCNRTAGRDGDQ